MYACINTLTKLMYLQQILYLVGINKYYGYGYSISDKRSQAKHSRPSVFSKVGKVLRHRKVNIWVFALPTLPLPGQLCVCPDHDDVTYTACCLF